MNNNVVQVVRPPVIRESRCENCVNAHQIGAAWQCRADLPKAFMVGLNELGQPVIVGAWAPVSPTDWCAHHKRGVML